MDTREELTKKIIKLKKKREAIILAHYYQLPEIQDVADFIGDSFDLSRKAARSRAKVIVFCGVKFMAESASILSPDKIVLLPEKFSNCPLAEMADIESLKSMKKRYPKASVVSYVNSTAEIKAESDVCCTSSNALKIVEKIDNDQIIFLPDKNLGDYVSKSADKEVIIWNGYCPAHHSITAEEVENIKKTYPNAEILVHPECKPEVVDLADYVGSTTQILNYAKNSKADTLIIGTEEGILYPLKKENPDKTFYILNPFLICPDMKKINLEKIYHSLKNMETIIEVPKNIRMKAKRALDRMLELSD
jgi:quinolinate synthase